MQSAARPVLRIDLRASWTLAAILTVAHGSALAAVLTVSIPLWLQVIAAAALAANLARLLWRNALLKSPAAVVAIEIASDDVLSIRTRRGNWVQYDVCDDTYVLWFLTVLNLRRARNGRRVSVALLPDAIHADDFRKLRVWLRWKGKTRTPTV